MSVSIRNAMVVLMIMAIGFYADAQNPAPPAASQTSPKDEFIKNLKDFQPKLDDLNAKTKEYASKMPDFAKEVNSLNDQVSAFKSKLDKFDATAKDQQSQLVTSLRTDWSSIQTQYKKVTDLWTKGHPEDALDKSRQQQQDDQVPPKQ